MPGIPRVRHRGRRVPCSHALPPLAIGRRGPARARHDERAGGRRPGWRTRSVEVWGVLHTRRWAAGRRTTLSLGACWTCPVLTWAAVSSPLPRAAVADGRVLVCFLARYDCHFLMRGACVGLCHVASLCRCTCTLVALGAGEERRSHAVREG